jgi:hypothetical protein
MKNKNHLLRWIILLGLFVCFTALQAEEKPIQLALFAPIQLVPEETSIKGVRFNLLYGKNASVYGLDFGLVNHTTSKKSTAVQFGFLGIAETDFLGWQDNHINITKGNFEGVQSGFVNYANQMNGVQFGFVNYAGTMNGLQIGLINIIKQGGMFPVFPIVNWSF